MADWEQLDATLRPWLADADEVVPPDLPVRSVCRPKDVDQVPSLLRAAAEAGVAVYPVGGATAQDYGRVPRAEGIAVRTTGLDRLVDYPARDMTITVEAGITMRRLAALLGEQGQWLPVDVADAERATLGGALATNASGPRRYGYGTWRDYVIGISAVDAEGTAFKAGGRVVKNVAGYDLCKLLVGSLGTLGIVTQVTLKVRPAPEASALVAAAVGSNLSAIDETLAALGKSRTQPVCIELVNRAACREASRRNGCELPEADYVLVVGFEGTARAVQWQQQTFATELAPARFELVEYRDERCGPLWQSLTESAVAAPPADGEVTFKANVAASKVCELLEHCAGRAMILQSHAGNGIVEGRLTGVDDADEAADVLERLRDFATSAGGNLIVLRCPAGWKEQLSVWGRPRGDWELMRRIKQKLDPKGLLNPGRFIDGM